MSATTSDPNWPPAATLEPLAERLREGPFRTILTLHVRMCAATRADDGARLQQLVELLQLTQISMAQLRDLTFELQSRIDHLADAERQPQ